MFKTPPQNCIFFTKNCRYHHEGKKTHVTVELEANIKEVEKLKSEITKLKSENVEMENRIKTMEDKMNQYKKRITFKTTSVVSVTMSLEWLTR